MCDSNEPRCKYIKGVRGEKLKARRKKERKREICRLSGNDFEMRRKRDK
jgi:hypothetical protein